MKEQVRLYGTGKKKYEATIFSKIVFWFHFFGLLGVVKNIYGNNTYLITQNACPAYQIIVLLLRYNAHERIA